MSAERRHDYPHILERLARIEERLIAVDKRINGSIKDIENHIDHGHKWRLTIVAVAVTMLLNIGAGLYQYGKLCEKVEGHSRQIAGIQK